MTTQIFKINDFEERYVVGERVHVFLHDALHGGALCPVCERLLRIYKYNLRPKWVFMLGYSFQLLGLKVDEPFRFKETLARFEDIIKERNPEDDAESIRGSWVNCTRLRFWGLIKHLGGDRYALTETAHRLIYGDFAVPVAMYTYYGNKLLGFNSKLGTAAQIAQLDRFNLDAAIHWAEQIQASQIPEALGAKLKTERGYVRSGTRIEDYGLDDDDFVERDHVDLGYVDADFGLSETENGDDEDDMIFIEEKDGSYAELKRPFRHTSEELNFTIAECKRRSNERVNAGVNFSCFFCKRNVGKSKSTLNPSNILALRYFLSEYGLDKEFVIEGEYKNHIKKMHELGYFNNGVKVIARGSWSSSMTTYSRFGFVAKVRTPVREDGTSAGVYRFTEKGKAFLDGLISVPEYVEYFNNDFVGASKTECFADDFSNKKRRTTRRRKAA